MQMPQKSLNLETYLKNLESRSERTLICFSLVFQEVTLSRHWSDNKTLNKEFYLYTVNRSVILMYKSLSMLFIAESFSPGTTEFITPLS